MSLPTTSPSVEGPDHFGGTSAPFLKILAEGMHSIAQPLTVLRAMLELASLNTSSLQQYEHFLETSLAESIRVTESVQFVQELIRVASETPIFELQNITKVIDMVREDLSCVLDQKGIALR